MKKLLTPIALGAGAGLLLAGVIMAVLTLLDGCRLRDPVPVEPNYPPEPPFTERRASKDGASE